ncbi:MAG: hypothetical protein ACOVQJ_02105 [Bacteroidia bacterium]|jgi:hypothetical protein
MKKLLLLLSLAVSLPLLAQEETDSTEENSMKHLNLHATRYAFSPSAYPVPRGMVYYQTFDFLMHDIQVGVTDNFSMGIGYGLPLFAYITPKYSFTLGKKTRLAIGDMATSSMFLSAENAIRANIAYSALTLGTPATNITFGAGLLSHNIGSKANMPIGNIGAMQQISKNIYMVFELWGTTGTYTDNYTKSTWQRDGAGNIITETNSWGNVSAKIVNEEKSITGPLNMIFGNLQFRFIGSRVNTSSWSFGLSCYTQNGKNSTITQEYSYGNYGSPTEFASSQEIVGVKNRFIVLPSITFVKKFGDLSMLDNM